MSLISRQRMEEVIGSGGSIMVGGEIVTTIKDLPSEVELAELELLISSWVGWGKGYSDKLLELEFKIRTRAVRS